MLFISFASFAQRKVEMNYSFEKVKALAKEVYADVQEYQTDQHIYDYMEYLNQIEIVEMTTEEIAAGNYPLISTLILRNKYNQDLVYDKGPDFNINQFNGLKYFYTVPQGASASPYYRIYGTNYLVRYTPK